MKILVACTPATGHLNPLLAISHLLMSEGHEIAFLSGSALRDRIENIGAEFYAFPAGADFDLRDFDTVAPELKTMAPGPEWLRVAMERLFVDPIPAQHQGLQQVLKNFRADVIVGDDMFFGVLPMVLGPHSKRVPVVACGTSVLHCQREDGAPHFLGLPPATSQAQREEYGAINREYGRIVDQPVGDHLNRTLEMMGIGPLSMTLFDSIVHLVDTYLQLTVPSFEFPRELPRSVHFVGVPPIIPKQVMLPSWADELDGSRKVVLVTQGTLANHNFGLLVGPTLQALANEPDVLVVATAGGRPVEAIPGPIPSNARLAEYLPFEWLLPKVDVLVTNGGYGSVNQALSFGIPLVTAGLTEDKADVNARVAWSGVGIDLATNEPTVPALLEAVRAVLDSPNFGSRASLMATEFDAIGTRSEIVRLIKAARPVPAGRARRVLASAV
jgi:UDP:flavonoid glycosyltransferase YjiC (YdhE family)